MKWQTSNLLTILAITAAFPNTGICNDPDPDTPWPVAFALSGMNVSHTLMNSYGDLNGSWESSLFHGGIDIDATTGEPDCNEVRCVDDGYATVVDRVEITGNPGHYEWIVIICDSLDGAVENGWSYGHLTEPSFSEEEYVAEGELIGYMNENVSPPHLHFMWNKWNSNHMARGNPLQYLDAAPLFEEGYTWKFDPEEHDPPHEYFFLEQMWYTEWEDLTVSEILALMLEPSDLSGNVDFFFGVGLRGDGMPGGEGEGRNDLAPQKIKWDVVREYPSGDQILDSKYVVDFNCWLSNEEGLDSRAQMLYFRKSMNAMFGFDALLYCLSNCIDSGDWDGINTVNESSWNTDSDCEEDGSTENPVLAKYPDGPYRLDITCYSFDEDSIYPASIDVELHNFSPVVEEVVIICDGRTIWQAFWTADGLMPEWHNPVDLAVLPDQELDVTVVFSEPMDTTSVTVTAGVSSPYNDITASDTGLNWSWTNCPEEPQYKDTWHGVFNDLTGCTFGRMTISIQAQDHDLNGLTDPLVSVYDGRYNDTHHSFSVMGIQPGWPVTLSENVYGSPTIADLDGDGDLDVSLICDDGNVYLLDDDGASLVPGVWPKVISEWDCYPYYLKSSPALADLYEDGNLDLIAFLTPGCGAEAVSDGSNIPGWPVYPGDPETGITGEFPGQSSPVLSDLDGDGHLELLFTRHMAPNVTTYEHTICMYDHTGIDEIWSRNLQPFTYGASVISTPAIGDVDGDGDLEVVVCTAEGFELVKSLGIDEVLYSQSAVYLLDGSSGSTIWKQPFSAWFQASPVIADVDYDGINEIIVGTDFSAGPGDRRKLFVLNGYNGSVEYEEYLGDGVYHSAAVGYINNDNYLDFVVPCNNHKIYAYSGADYSYLPGFPVDIGEIPGSPILIDVDMDMDLEIVFGTSSGSLWALNSDGTTCSGFPVFVGGDIRGCPAAGELDGDGHLEIVMVDSDNPAAYCLDLGAGTFPAEMPWRQFQHDSWHTGCFEADNTIPEPPTNLSGEITYNGGSCEVDLEWDLSVNDPYSGSPEEPTDVIGYLIYRIFKPISMANPKPVGKVRAGNSFFTDIFDSSCGSGVVYWVKAFDGTNESECSNYIKFPTSPSDVISLGCSVVEEFSIERVSTMTIRIPDRAQVIEMDESSNIERTSVRERTTETIQTATLDAVPAAGNPCCLTDGSVEVCYAPSPGADAVVIDLGEECTVTSVIFERISDNSLGISLLTDGSVRTALAVEPSLLIEVAGFDREFYTFAAESHNSTDAVRYIRIHGASGLTEISVYGSRGAVIGVSSVEITRSVENEGWMFAIPVVEYSEEASVNIYDVSGRMIWSGHGESGSVLHWDGFTENGTAVPNGVYLLHCSVGSEVSTGSFVVRRN